MCCCLFIFFLIIHSLLSFFFFFFNDTATTEIYTLSLHDALPIYGTGKSSIFDLLAAIQDLVVWNKDATEVFPSRSEEHTSELQSQSNLVCRLLLEKKKKPVQVQQIHHAQQLKRPGDE